MNPVRILVVEDEFIVAKEIEMRVAAMGYQVVESALNAEEALKLAEKHCPDLILMDIHLQGEMDGITAAEEIRRRFHLPVIFLTAYSEDATLERAKRAEPFGYILKPFEERELKSAIEIALYKHHAEREILRLNRLYDVLSQVNQAIVRANSREDLLESICRIMVERGAIDLAWIGWLDPETARIHPIAHWGRHEALLNRVVFYADDRPEGHGNPGRAIREDKPVFCNECIRGNCLYPAEFAPAQFGFNSCGSFPIHFQGRVCGTLNLGIIEVGCFQEREIELLEEVAQDISFALDKLDGDARRVQAEDALRKSEEQYRLLVETSNEGIWAMDGDHVTTYVNRAMAEMLGYKPSEIIGTKVEEYFLPEDLSFHRERMKHRHAGQDEVYERRFRRRDGTSLWTLVSAKALKDDLGHFLGSFAMFNDITERKQAEEALHQRNRQMQETVLELEQARNMLRLIIESIPVRVFWKDRDSHYLGCNSLFARDAGLDHPDELLGKDDFATNWAEQADLYRADDRLVMESGLPKINIIEPQRTPSGSKIWLNTTKVPLCLADGEVFGVLGVYEDVTDRKEAEAALRKSEEKQRSILRAAPIGIGVVVDRVLMEANDYLCTMTGYSKEELLGKDARILYPTQELYVQVGREKYRQIAEMGTGIVETQWKKRDGVVLDVLLSSSPIDPADLLAGVTFTALDITERKRAEAALRRSEERHRSIIQAATDGYTLVDLEGHVLEVNEKYCRMSGYSAEELLNMRTYQLDADHTADEISDHGCEMMARGEARFEARHRRKDGTVYDVEISIQYRPTDGGQLVAFLRDITERKQAEMDLERVRNILSEGEKIAHMGTFEYVVDSQTTVWSEEEFRIYGLDPSGPSPTYDVMLAECIHPDDAVLLHQTFMTAMQNNSIYELEHRIVRPDGSVRWVYDRSHAYYDENGRLLRYIGSTLDITERKQAEEALRESEEKYRKLLEDASDAILLVDAETGILLGANRQATVLTGWSQGELQGMHQRELHPAKDGGNSSATFREHLATPGRTKEAVVRHKDGRHIPVEITASSFTLSGRPVLQGIYRDVTERKKAEQEKARLESQLRHAQKLEAIGTLAGGIAHDFNNILSPIIGYTEMAMDGIEESSPSRYDLDQVLIAANRAKDLVKQILSFSRLGEEQLMRPIDVSLIVKEALKLLRASLPSTIEIKQNIHKVTILADATQIHQVVVNLSTNAAHAMEDMGVLDVSLLQVDLSAADLVALSLADLRPGMHLKLSIKDTGCGMSPDAMHRIFDPYFTTKEVGKGTGLGLAVVHGIVKRHAGEILVKSEVGTGSVFDVLIPVVASKLKLEGAGPQTLPKGSERILLVDDEPPIAAMGTRILEQLGYKVTAMTSPKEALDLFRSQPDQFDLIITDYTMPQMVGTQLANECRRIRAEIPAIICTGHSERLNKEEPEQIGANAVALKPLDRRQLAMLVREVLDKTTS
jgi:PAS domain S-box-containing protein